MDPATITALSQFGLGGIVFVVWYFDKKDRDGLQLVVSEQIEDKALMREDRQKLLEIIEGYSTLTTRLITVLDRIDKVMSAGK